MTRKLHGWDERLAAWARRRIGAPFVWGETDCTMLALEAYDALTGGVLALAYRGLWRSVREAVAFRRCTGADLVLTLRQQGCTMLEPLALRAGDILAVRHRNMWYANVCFGDRVLSARPECGVAWWPTRPLLEYAPLVLRVPLASRG